MKLWLLRPREDLPKDDRDNNPWDPWYDKAFGFVVRAEDEAAARALAAEDAGDEERERERVGYEKRGNPWLSADFSTCVELTPEGEAEVVIRDFASA